MKSKTIAIILNTPTVYLYGERSDSAGCLLTGSVCLNINTPQKVSYLTVSLNGTKTLKYTLKNPSIHQKQTRQIINDTHFLISATKRSTTRIHRGQHVLQFEFVIPGGLPTTTDTKLCKVNYTVSAKLGYAGLRSNENAVVPVNILRCPVDGGLWASATLEQLSSSVQWNNRVTLCLNHDQCAASDNSTIGFIVGANTTVKNHRLQSLDLQLRETHTVYSKGNQMSPIYRETKVVAQKYMFFGSHGCSLSGQDEFCVRLRIPAVGDGVSYEMECAEFTVTHRLILTALVKDPQGPVVEMTIPVRFSVMPEPGILAITSLPLYENTKQDRLVQSSTMYSGNLDHNNQLPPYTPPACHQHSVNSTVNAEYDKGFIDLRGLDTQNAENTDTLGMAFETQAVSISS